MTSQWTWWREKDHCLDNLSRNTGPICSLQNHTKAIKAFIFIQPLCLFPCFLYALWVFVIYFNKNIYFFYYFNHHLKKKTTHLCLWTVVVVVPRYSWGLRVEREIWELPLATRAVSPWSEGRGRKEIIMISYFKF